MNLPLPEPTDAPYDTGRRLCDYLDYFRSTVATKVATMPASALRTSRLPSGWTPIELVNHLVHMERRWLVWGFRGEPVDRAWGDEGPDGRWSVGAEVSLTDLLAYLTEGGVRTRRIVASSALSDRAQVGGRFDADPPTLQWILLHVLQEYARHVGHLDIVRELSDGVTGE